MQNHSFPARGDAISSLPEHLQVVQAYWQQLTAAMDGARNRRSKKVSGKLGVVTDDDKQHAIKARLDALENDDNVKEDPAAGSDEEYVLEESDEELGLGENKRKKRKRGSGSGAKRKTRAALTEHRGPKSFATLLEEADLESLPPGQPSYLTAAVGPPTGSAPRKWCSVCGFASPYKAISESEKTKRPVLGPSTHSADKNGLVEDKLLPICFRTPRAKLDGSDEPEQCFEAAATCAMYSQQQFSLAASKLQTKCFKVNNSC